MALEETTSSSDKLSRELGFGTCFSNGPSHVHKATDQRITSKFFLFFDLCLVWLSGAIACWLTYSLSPAIPKIPLAVFLAKFAGFLLLISLLIVLAGNLRGLYSFPWRSNFRRLLGLEAETVVSAAAIAGSCMYLWKIRTVPPELFVSTIFLSWVSLVAWRKFIEAQPIAGLTEKRNVLIAGCGKNARLLRAHLEQNPELGFVVKGFLDRRQKTRQANQGWIEAEDGLLGGIKELPAITRAHFIDEIFVSVPVTGTS